MSEELIQEAKKYKLIYISGKTCTGKTTLSRVLAKELICSVIETDRIVQTTKCEISSNKFVEIYRNNNIPELVDEFVSNLRLEIDKDISTAGSVIFEGAIANNDVLRKVIKGLENNFMFIYLHPVNKDIYIKQITERFQKSSEEDNAGLPPSFYKLIDSSKLKKYYQTGYIDLHIQNVIDKYSVISMQESSERLRMFKDNFTVYVINV